MVCTQHLMVFSWRRASVGREGKKRLLLLCIYGARELWWESSGREPLAALVRFRPRRAVILRMRQVESVNWHTCVCVRWG